MYLIVYHLSLLDSLFCKSFRSSYFSRPLGVSLVFEGDWEEDVVGMSRVSWSPLFDISGYMVIWHPVMKSSIATRVREHVHSCILRIVPFFKADGMALLQNSRKWHCNSSSVAHREPHRHLFLSHIPLTPDVCYVTWSKKQDIWQWKLGMLQRAFLHWKTDGLS